MLCAESFAAGLDVIDFAITKHIRSSIDFNLSIDNLTNKRYYETQNFFSSRLPGEPLSDLRSIQQHACDGFRNVVAGGFFVPGKTWRRIDLKTDP
jgi:outer membrane receptor protein involved in Fe transport